MSPEDRPAEELRRLIARRKSDRREVLRRSAALGLGAPAAASLLAACGGGEGRAAPFDAATPGADEGAPSLNLDAQEADPAPGNDQPRGGGGTVRLLYWQAPTILNAHLAQGVKDAHAARICAEPLFDWDIDTNPVLALAAEWPSVENGLLDPAGRSVVWKLRPGVTWHDGAAFTAEDVRFTWEYARYTDITATTAGAYAAISDVEVIDDLAVRVHFSASNPAWFEPFSGVTGVILPKHVLGPDLGTVARSSPFNLMPVGTGPWKVSAFRPGEGVLYVTATNAVRQRNQEIVKADLEQLGFQVELKSVDPGIFFSSDAGNPDTYAHFYADLEMFTNGPSSPYPISWARRFRGDEIAGRANDWSAVNITRYNNPAYDALHDRAQSAVGQAEQDAIWAEMLALVSADVVEVPIVWRGGVAAVHKRIKNWRSSVFGATPVAFLKDWTL